MPDTQTDKTQAFQDEWSGYNMTTNSAQHQG